MLRAIAIHRDPKKIKSSLHKYPGSCTSRRKDEKSIKDKSAAHHVTCLGLG
jgi:hypothetical protein